MGCCGCSLAASTVTAVVLGLVESIVGMAWNILVIVIIELHRTSNSTETSSENNFTTVLAVISESTSTEPSSVPQLDYWESFKITLTSPESLEKEHIFELTVTALVLNSFWLITTLALAVGNSEKCRDMLKPWVATTILITITDIAATIYFIFKAVKEIGADEFDLTKLVENIFVLFAILFSRGGIIVWIANVALCIFVAQRIKQIEVLKKKRFPFDADMHFTPYTLHSPYEAYEADSSRSSKHVRPHTPPPDYEPPTNGYSRKSRRLSYPSDYETLTLPVSMISNSTGLRPSSRGSYLYDDRVDMQHRASAAAETVVNHAYDNKGLEMEVEGWIGIPRPTLKVTR